MSIPPPPPAKKSRSFKQMKEDIKRLEEENSRLKEQSLKKTKPTPESINKKNPDRTNPDPSLPTIKLNSYATEFIEQDRSNVVVELNSDFEDPVIKPHAQIVHHDNLTLIGLNGDQKQEVSDTYEAFSILNLCYRLLITLPASYRLEAKNLLDAMKADDVPQNTAVISEMLSHIGKTKTDNYGNLRLLYPLQLAKKKILKAMMTVKDHQFFQDNFQLKRGSTLDDIKKSWRTGIFIDSDGPDFLAMQALKLLEDDDASYKFKIGTTDCYWTKPDLKFSEFYRQGRFRPSVDHVSKWCRSCRTVLTAGTEEWTKYYYKICCAMIAQIIDLRYIRSGLTLGQWNHDFKDSKLMDITWEDFSTYIGIVDLGAYISNEQLANNYFIIMDRYRTVSEKHVRSVFKLNPIKKDEFGTEAQMMICYDWKPDGNNAVDASFKVNDANKAVASGVFNFARNIQTSTNDRMYLKNSFRSIISNLISNFSRK